MDGLKLFRKKAAPPASPDDTASRPVGGSSQVVPPRRALRLGKWLAFTLEDDAVHMAAATHFGPKVVLKDVKTEYILASQNQNDNRNIAVRDAIRGFIEEHGGRSPEITVTVSGPQTALRSVSLPALSKKNLDAAVAYEAKRQIPFPHNDCSFGYRVVERKQNGNESQVRIALLAATRQLVAEALAPFEDLGVDVAHVYHSHDVVGHLLKWLPGFKPDSGFTLVNVQKTQTQIAYYTGTRLEFVLISSLGSSFLANRTDPTMFEYFAESLSTEIQNSLDYYSGQFSTRMVNDVYVYGDLAYSDELMNLLGDSLGHRFKRFPTEGLPIIDHNNKALADALPVSLPAVAAATDQSRLVDFIPPVFVVSRRKRQVNRLGSVALIVLMLLLAGHWNSGYSALKSSRENLQSLDRRIAEFQATETYATYNHLKRKIASSQGFLEKTREQPSFLGLGLKELTRLTPPGVRLYNLGFQNESLSKRYQLTGVIESSKTPPELILAEFIENLSASPFYEKVSVDRHVKKRGADRFLLDFDLSMDGII